MKEIHLEQGTADWLAWRAGESFVDIHGVIHDALDGPRITATAASVCGGHSPFATPHELWGITLGLRPREDVSWAMKRGSALEPKARYAYTQIVGEEYEALCVESMDTPWIAASLDGVDLLRTRGVEIKCPISEKTHDMAMLGIVPSYYYDQMQWQMLSTDNQLTEMDYFSFAPQIGEAKPILVKVDLQRQRELVDLALKFRLAVMTRVPLSGSEFDQAAKAYLVLNRKLKALDEQVEAAKERVKQLAAGKPTQGGGVIVTVSNSDGRPSWEKIALDLVARIESDADQQKKLIDELKQTHKGKPTTTVSVKEAADADAVYEEIKASTNSESSTPKVMAAEDTPQPNPVW